MPSKNKINVLGHAGRDAEFKDVGSGLLTFSVATSSGYKDKDGEWQNSTTWFTVKCWGANGARLAGKILKGDLVDVTGKVALEEWEAKDGTQKSSLVITAFPGDVLPLTKHEPAAPAATVDDDSELPF